MLSLLGDNMTDKKDVEKILLIDPLLRRKHEGLYDDFQKNYDIPYGLLAIASHMESKGVGSKVVSMDFETDARQMSDEDVLRKQLSESKPKIVGFTSYTLQFDDAKRLAAIVKEHDPEIKVVIGGHHAMHQADAVLETGLFDAVVVGEGEKAFEQYVQNVLAEQETDKVLFPSKRLEGEEIVTPKYSLLPKEMVENSNPEVMTSRGCPWDCGFCSSSAQYGRKVKTRSLESVQEELVELAEKYGHKEIGILDETMHARGDFAELMGVLRQVHEEKGVSYVAQTRADQVLRNPESLDVMKEAGIELVLLGAESGSEKVLEAMNKRSDYETIPVALRLIKQAGMKAGTFWIVGHPGSSYEEEMKTKDAIDTLCAEGVCDLAEINIFIPYAGSRASRSEELQVLEKDHAKWNRAGEPVYELQGFPREKIKQAYNEIVDVLDRYGMENGKLKE
jgi:anaerobic magnesium-protoporphyrin IX monomethyl ester cyclase